MAKEGKRRRYTGAEKEEALRLAREVGVESAAVRLRMGVSSINVWRKQEREGSHPNKAQAPGAAQKKARSAAVPLKRYSTTQRENALQRVEVVGQSATARELNIPLRTITRWLQDVRKNGEVNANPGGEPPDRSTKSTGGSSPTKVAKNYTPSERARILEFAASEGVTAAAIKYSVTRFSIYEWRRRTRLHAEGKAHNSPVTGSDDDRAAARDHRILSEWKTHPGLGPSQIRNQLRRQGFKVSVHTVRCVLEENGYVTPKVRRHEGHDQRYEAVRPNHLWHLDFLHRHINNQKIFVLLIIDDYSRFIVGGAIWDGERVQAACDTLLSSVNRHGRPERAMSDGGSAFFSWKGIGQFTHLLSELEIDQLIATTPEVNGKLEALNANIQKEVFDKIKFFDLSEVQRGLNTWIQFYNLRRTHHSLGGLLVPADRYFGRADQVLAQIEAGHDPTGIGEPVAPSERHLDLFRITSHRGEVEIYLLGKRIVLPAPNG